MRKKKSIFAFGALAALVSLGAFASGELRRVGTIDIGDNRAKVVSYVSDKTYAVPFEFKPTYAQFEECAHVDNYPARSWGYDTKDGAFIIYHGTPLDNWIILPGVQMYAGEFNFSCEYKTMSMAEDFTVCLLSAKDDVSKVVTTLIDKSGYQNSTYEKGEKKFTVDADGVYYIALHATSDNKHGIMVRNFAISNASGAQPEAPFISSYTMNGHDGTFNVEVPAATVGGAAITGSVNIDMTVDGECVKTEACTPGSLKSIDYTFTTGQHDVSFTAWTQNGDKREISAPAKMTVEAYALAPEYLEIPFVITPTEDEARWCTIFNPNNDQTWEYKTTDTPGNEPAFVYRYDSGNPADDWVVLPMVNFDEPGMYELTFDLATDMSEEKFEVSLADNVDNIMYDGNKIAIYDDFSTQRTWREQTIRLSIKSKGKKCLAFHAASRKNRGRIYLKNIAVNPGEDNTPLAPEFSEIKMDGDAGTISAVMPLESYSGSQLTSDVTAHFSIDNGPEQTVVAAPGELAVLNVSGLAKGKHTVSVYASIEDEGLTLNSESVSREFTVTASSSFRYTLPVSINLADDFLDLTVLDANKDGFTWTVNNNAIEYPYCSINQGDDWAFTRPVTVTEENAARILRLAVDAKCAYSLSAESFEIWLGSAANPESMTRKVIDVSEINNTDYVTFSNEFALQDAGDYVIGIHAVSRKASSYLYLQNLTFAATSRSSEVPGEVDNLYAEGDQTGALKATVYFTFPAKDARGKNLDAGSNLVLTATCGDKTASVSGKPCEDASVEIETSEGENTISVFCSNANGPGLASETTVTCGLDRPSIPRILSTTVSEDNYSVDIRWRAVTTGENEGIVNAPAMRYRVYTYYYDYEKQAEVWTEVEDTDKLTYTYSVPASMDYMESIGFGVEAYNAPESVSADRARTSAVLGKPYQLPIDETFVNETLHYGPVSLFSTLQGQYMPQWYIGNPAELNSSVATPDGWALIGHTNYTSGDTQVELPKFSTDMTADREGYEVSGFTITMRVYLFQYTPAMKFVGLYAGSENSPVEIGELDTSIGSGWVDVTYTLPAELNGKQWVAVRDMVDFTNGSSSWALIDGYSIRKVETNGVDEVSGGRSVMASTGAVTLRGFAGTEVSIADLSGKVIASRSVSSDQWSIALPAGVYVVKTCDGVHKVIVK